MKNNISIIFRYHSHFIQFLYKGENSFPFFSSIQKIHAQGHKKIFASILGKPFTKGITKYFVIFKNPFRFPIIITGGHFQVIHVFLPCLLKIFLNISRKFPEIFRKISLPRNKSWQGSNILFVRKEPFVRS